MLRGGSYLRETSLQLKEKRPRLLFLNKDPAVEERKEDEQEGQGLAEGLVGI